MQNKKPNHLATLLDHQVAARISLPPTLTNKLHQLIDLTNELRQLMVDSLPAEIVKSLLVVSYDNQELVLAVESQTAANHLTYLNQPLTQLIKSQSLTFNQLKNIKVIVSYIPKQAGMSPTHQSEFTSINNSESKLDSTKNSIKHHVNKDLAPKTKETIAYTAEHVILDPELKKSLKKLIE